MKTISAADANRHFSKLLREVKEGETVIVTSRGEPVARIEPIGPDEGARSQRAEAWAKLLARLHSQPALNLGKFNRDDAYE